MTVTDAAAEVDWIPEADTFGARLILIRQRMGWGNVKQAAQACGLPDVHLHRFRHWYATELLRAGANLRTVQECMRHDSLGSTAIYTRVDSAQRVAAIAALPS